MCASVSVCAALFEFSNSQFVLISLVCAIVGERLRECLIACVVVSAHVCALVRARANMRMVVRCVCD